MRARLLCLARRPAVVLSLLAALVAAGRLRTYDEPLQRDMTYALISHELLHGARL
jgi:hypothetical protein